jgi:hypothetical protein
MRAVDLFVFSVSYRLFELIIDKKRNLRHNAGMSELSQNARAAPRRSAASRARASGHTTMQVGIIDQEKGAKNILGLGGPRNPLKRLDSVEEIQGKRAPFLGSALAGLARLG